MKLVEITRKPGTAELNISMEHDTSMFHRFTVNMSEWENFVAELYAFDISHARDSRIIEIREEMKAIEGSKSNG